MTQRLQILMRLRRDGYSQLEAEKLATEIIATQNKIRLALADITTIRKVKMS